MNLFLVRDDLKATGAFGRLTDGDRTIAMTLEHSYEQEGGGWAPKVPVGMYSCVRGHHRLLGMAQPFETFEITGVPGHTNILFHCGNREADSEGCVLLGEGRMGDMVSQSRVAFSDFMKAVEGCDSFTLTVSNG